MSVEQTPLRIRVTRKPLPPLPPHLTGDNAYLYTLLHAGMTELIAGVQLVVDLLAADESGTPAEMEVKDGD